MPAGPRGSAARHNDAEAAQTVTVPGVLSHTSLPPRAVVRTRHFWTCRELAVLRSAYPVGGMPLCVERLPNRTASSIYNQVLKHKLTGTRGPAGKARQRWSCPPHFDDSIRRVYQRSPAKGDINNLARTLMRPRNWVTKRAVALGLVAPRFRELPWSEPELDLIREHSAKQLPAIRRRLKAAGFARSDTAIKVKLKRIGASRTDDPNHWTARGLAELMGVDGKTVTTWIEKGWLTAKRRGTARTEKQGGDEWWVARREMRQFVIDHLAHVDLRKVEKHWFVDLLVGHAA